MKFSELGDNNFETEFNCSLLTFDALFLYSNELFTETN